MINIIVLKPTERTQYAATTPLVHLTQASLDRFWEKRPLLIDLKIDLGNHRID